MNTIHPLFQDALRTIAPTGPAMQPYAVTIRMVGKTEAINIIASNAWDAIARARDIYFDGEDNMPIDGLAIDARPMNILRNAA